MTGQLCLSSALLSATPSETLVDELLVCAVKLVVVELLDVVVLFWVVLLKVAGVLGVIDNVEMILVVVIVRLVVVVDDDEVILVVVVLRGIYSGLHFSPDNTAQYFIHIKLRYCTLTKIVTKLLVDTLFPAVQSQYWFWCPIPGRIPWVIPGVCKSKGLSETPVNARYCSFLS